jgi:hypothetical protein
MWVAEAAARGIVAAGGGVGDCEAIRPGLLHQPANAVSSLALVLAAAWIAGRASRMPDERPELVALAAVVAANGLTSFAFHGPLLGSARWWHDLAALAIPLFVAVHDIGLVRDASVRSRLGAIGIGVVVLGALLALWPQLLMGLGFVGAVAAGIGELAAYRAGYRPRPGQATPSQIAAWGLVAALLGLAGLAFLLGRSASPWCEPESLLQAHAAWHVLVAVGSVAYVRAAFEFRGVPRSG